MRQKNIEFLTLAEVFEIHNNQIKLYGGEEGIRDVSLLSSALSIPQSTFDGAFLHKDIFEMASAYAYHVCQNHPFVDGNKRTALVCSLVFLDFNGVEIEDPEEILYISMMKMASGKLNKTQFAEILIKLSNI